MTTPTGEIRVLLVDDHPIVRDGLRGYLDRQHGLRVVGEASNGLDALEKARTLAPDVVLMDHTMPGMSGIEAVRHLRFVAPQAHVLILTMQEDREYVREARRAGARGYLVKDVSPLEVVSALEAVHRGEAFVTAGTSQALMEELQGEIRGAVSPASGPPLSRREKQVLALLASGSGSREIAARLGVGLRTVETHRLRLRRKLGIRSVAGLTKYAIDHAVRLD